MRRRTSPAIAAASILLSLAFGSGLGWAEPLAKEACEALRIEHAGFETAGVAETLKKGAAWGKANLSAAKLKEVGRYIELQEQLLFRCGLAKLKVLPGAEGEETGDNDKPAADKAAATPATESPPAPKAKPKPKPKAAEPVAESSEAPKPKPKPKAKADDAYKPPAPKDTAPKD